MRLITLSQKKYRPPKMSHTTTVVWGKNGPKNTAWGLYNCY